MNEPLAVGTFSNLATRARVMPTVIVATGDVARGNTAGGTGSLFAIEVIYTATIHTNMVVL